MTQAESLTVLVLNPGSTSTKLALYGRGKSLEQTVIRHTTDELRRYGSIWGHFPVRLNCCLEWALPRLKECSAVVAIGGLFRPLEGGTYAVNEAMLRDARANIQGEHASNLGCALAHEIAQRYKCPAFVVDPVSVDEFEPLARYSGHPAIERRSLSHALNIHAVARRASRELNIPPEHSAFVIAHLGGGISIAAVRGGKIIDVNDAASDGPFSPERTGGLPLQQLIALCYAGTHTEGDMRAFVMGKGGLAAYLGTNSAAEVEDRINAGDSRAREVFEAMAYQIAKEIAAMSSVFRGKVDAIVLTGGMATSSLLTCWIEERVRFIAPFIVFPGSDEMGALASGALRVLDNQETLRDYA